MKLKQIIHNSDLVSKPVRDNFQTIEDTVNDQQNQIDMIVAPPIREDVNLCETLTGWSTGGQGYLQLDTVNKIEGSASISFWKAGIDLGSTLFSCSFNPNRSFGGKLIKIWIRMATQEVVDHMNAGQASYVDIGAGANFRRWVFGGNPAWHNFKLGWNEYVLDWDAPDQEFGTVSDGMICTEFEFEWYAHQPISNYISLINLDDIHIGPNDRKELENAREGYDSLRGRINGLSRSHVNRMVYGGLVTELNTPGMGVKIAEGAAEVYGVGCTWEDMTSGTITAPVTHPRWDTVVINSDRSISILSGVEAASLPALPTVSPTQKKVAHIYLVPGQTSILNINIRDARKEMAQVNEFSYGLPPVGSIIAWHKSMTNMPALLDWDCWQECDGGTIFEPESPLYGQSTPLLNETWGRHLEGYTTSGLFRDSSNKSHNHTITDPGHNHTLPTVDDAASTNSGYLYLTSTKNTVTSEIASATTGISLAAQGDTEARPKSFTVVWIIRIK